MARNFNPIQPNGNARNSSADARPSQTVRQLIVVAGYAVLWLALWHTASLYEISQGASVWYPPAGLTFGVLILFGLRFGAVAFVLQLIVGAFVWLPDHPAYWVLAAVVIPASYTMVVGLLLRQSDFDPLLSSVADIARLVAVAGIGAAVIALAVVAMIAAAGWVTWEEFTSVFLGFWVGDLIGVVMIAPLMLMYLGPLAHWTTATEYGREGKHEFWVDEIRRAFRQKYCRVEFSSWLVISLAILWFVFSTDTINTVNFEYMYLVFLPLFWISLRFGLPGSTAGILILNIGVIVVIRYTEGETALLYMQTFMLSMSLAGLFVGALTSSRWQVARSLTESEDRFRLIAETIQEIFWMRDTDTNKVVYISPAAKEIWGVSPETLYAEPEKFMEAIHPEDRDRVSAAFQRQLDSRFDEQYRIIHPDGAQRWIRDRAFPVCDARGHIRSVIGLAEDITAHKRMEMALKESEERLSAYIEHSPVGISLKDRDGRFILINRELERAIGKTNEEVVGKTTHNLYDKTFEESVLAHDKIVLDEDRTVEWESAVELKDGLHIWAITKFPLHDAAGAVTAIGSIGFDITERKQAEEALRESEERFRVLVQNNPYGIQEIDTRGHITFTNPAHDKIFGYAPGEMLGKPIWEKVSSETERDNLRRYIVKLVREQPPPTPFFEQDRTKDGRLIDVLVHWAYKRDSEGRIIGFISTLSDVTDRKAAEAERERLEAQLRQAQKMEAVGTLAGGIAHDFNNILAGMSGYAHLVIDDVPAGSQAHSDIEEILKSIDRATGLVKQLLAFSRRSDAESHPVEVGRVVEETLKLLRATISATIEIRSEIDREVGSVMADATQLQQVVMNLCTNAADAIGPVPGMIKVGLTGVELDAADTTRHADLAPGPYVKLSVSDNGTGMDEATQARVFEPFFTTKEVGKGTGLGLAAAHGIVRDYGGMIEVESAPGRGATFTVLLPRTQAAERDVPQVEPDIPRGRERILLVDDEAAIVHSEARLLERLGYTVEAATSSVGALAAFRAAPEAFDLIITDQAMPELSGMTLAQETLKLRGDIPIILCSGFSEVIGAEDAKAVGIREFMLKPIRPDDLARAVRRVLDGDAPGGGENRGTGLGNR